MKWYLILQIYSCTGGGIDPGIVPGACGNREVRVEMPSIEVCRAVRAVNPSSKCLTEDTDK